MKLRNKKTGEIGTPRIAYQEFYIDTENKMTYCYKSLQEVFAEWEDAPEEPKGIQCIYYVNHFDAAKINGVIVGFESKAEAEKAVEKLKAWKRLKDTCNFRFTHWVIDKEKAGGKICFRADEKMITFDEAKRFYNDFYLLFGDEDERHICSFNR